MSPASSVLQITCEVGWGRITCHQKRSCHLSGRRMQTLRCGIRTPKTKWLLKTFVNCSTNILSCIILISGRPPLPRRLDGRSRFSSTPVTTVGRRFCVNAPSPHGAPQIIALIAKAFQDVQLRWSAMERELYALWQGVVGHERLIKGFKVFCYMDHKNNLFSEAQLDNRRRSKK